MAAVAGPQSGKGLLEPKNEAEDMQLDKPVTEEGEGDLYTRLKILQRQIEFFDIQVLSVPAAGASRQDCQV